MSEALSVEGRLCTACGLCCTGALHTKARLDPDEVEPAAMAGLPVRFDDPTLSFSLPCPKLEGTICTIFPKRPRVCGAYACRLLEEVSRGRSLDHALPLVVEAQRLVQETFAVLPPDTSLPRARDLRATGQASAAATLRTFALDHFLDRHFRAANESQFLKSEPC